MKIIKYIGKIIAKLIALPLILVMAVAWVFAKLTITLISVTHGLFWLLIAILAVFAITSKMWFQLAQIIGWGVVSYIIVAVGVGVEITLESTMSRLVAFVCHA